MLLTVDGHAVEIEPKPLQVLVHLLEHAGKLVTKDALIQAVWPRRIIGDAALTKCIARLRESIGDHDQRLIKTHHRYGYRLVVPVETPGLVTPKPTNPVPAEHVPAAVEAARPAQDAEHRPVTILFCDLVGSTELADTLDPETFRAVLLNYQQSAAELAHRYEGHVARQFGDGLLFYFGYPSAHDNDAERALRFAFDLLRAQRADPTRTLEAPGGLRLRIGIHTGPLMIGPGPSGDALATGASLHLAARLQALAEPDSILVSDATFRLVPGLFVTRDFGLQKFRGLSEAVRVHQVLQPSGVRSRLEAAERLTAFVGRDNEIAVVKQSWSKAFEGQGQAILFSGEPGLGKSRLLMELRRHLAGRAHTWLEARSDALNRHSAFHVVGELLRRGFALQDASDDAQRIARVEQELASLGLDPAETIPLLGPVMNLPETERYPESKLAPDVKRARTLDALAGWIERLASEQPMVLAVEDLHWCDDSSLEFIGTLLARLAQTPILLVMTTRPEFESPWPMAASLHARVLDVLGQPEMERMLADLGDGAAFAPALMRLVCSRAGGVPLFVEELTRALRESGQLVENDGRLEAKLAASDLAVPDSLNSLLRARLDRLGPARGLIQAAAVIGAECSHRQLQFVTGLEESPLRAQLAQLIKAGMLHPRVAPPDANYVFKHALIRDSAYAALLKSTRQRLHERTAQALEALYPQQLDERCGELAHHHEQAGHAESAAAYAQRAAERAMRQSANREAAAHLATAIRINEGLEKSAERVQNLVMLHSNLGVTLTVLNGYTDPAACRAYQTARELSRDLGETAALAPVLFGLGAYYSVIADYPTAIEIVQQLDVLGQRLSLAPARISAHLVGGQSLYCMGRFADAERSFRTAITLYEAENASDIAVLFQEDPCVSSRATLAAVLWSRGYPDAAAAESRCSLEHARKLDHPYSMAIACTLNALVAQIRGDVQGAAELARESIALSTAQGFPFYVAWAEILLGWSEAQSGRASNGATLIREATLTFNGNGASFLRSWALLMLADAQGRTGAPREALATLAQALDAADSRGENAFLPDIHRLRGELLLQAGHENAVAEAEHCYRKALDVARALEAPSPELRAATSLARLLQAQCRAGEADALLRPVYQWFTEGFETPDLREAAALLDTSR